MQRERKAKVGVDIGGTFTDVAMEIGNDRFTRKVLTTPRAPEIAVLSAIDKVLTDAKVGPRQLALIVHGTTLVTNALIERKGAKTSFITTEGFRDVLDIRTENRFEQYDLSISFPPALVPRDMRLTVRERIGARGEVLVALEPGAVEALVPALRDMKAEAIAIGFLHSYANPVHEQLAAAVLRKSMPGVAITLSSEVSPEMREYERFSTTCANAYVQPVMSRYLKNLEAEIRARRFDCPLLMMLSGGGLATLETSIRFPVRLVESGPAGGAIFSSYIARQCDFDKVLSFDMGGTTAKICLIDDFMPQTHRSFEVARTYRFKKGSGLPLRIPVIEMVEIGAGGGSLTAVDVLRRVAVGPESAGAEPGPACYGRGGKQATVTDADLILGYIDPSRFAGGSIELDRNAAEDAVTEGIAAKLRISTAEAANAIVEIVNENMANAARVHAVESGKDVRARTLIAFGGAAPLHVARLAEKLGIERFLVPSGAGVGSAVGFLRAPIAYEVVRSGYQPLDEFDTAKANNLLTEMQKEAQAIVRAAAPHEPIVESRTIFMRYSGQGHQVPISIPTRELHTADAALFRELFERQYRDLYTRVVPGVGVEILDWVVRITTLPAEMEKASAQARPHVPEPTGTASVFDQQVGGYVDVPIYWRSELIAGAIIRGPAVIGEDETSTVITNAFEARINESGYIDCRRFHKNEDKCTKAP